MTAEILLKDILKFDELRQKYPNKKIKLRFNTPWYDTDKTGKTVERNQLLFYKSTDKKDRRFLEENILSVFSPKGKSRIAECDIIFQFIQISSHRWLLIDAVNIINKIRKEKGYNDLTGCKFDVADGEHLSCFDSYYDRLIVDWKNKPQTFFYNNKDIVDNVVVREILPQPYLELDNDFPGYENILHMYRDLKSSIYSPEWQAALESVYGVYVLTDVKTGEQYIGSATGNGGIFGRWRTYLESGFKDDSDYPNVRLQELVKKKKIKYIEDNFQFAILEIFNKNEDGKRKALSRETHWKKVLRTKDYGYNAN